jgi:hypothetical protein
METPHSVERNDGFPVTIEVERSRCFRGRLRTDAGRRATLKQKDGNAEASKITTIRMGRQDRPLDFEALHKNPYLTRVSRLKHTWRRRYGLLSMGKGAWKSRNR